VFLHCQFFRDVHWPKVVQAKEVRLVVPLLVVEQLDRQSYESKPYKARARAVLRSLHELQEGLYTPEVSAVVRPKVTLQMLMDTPDHERVQNEDDELLDRAEYLSSLVNGRVVVVTRDLGMELKARLRGIKSLHLLEEPRGG
jgi:predicted ribonuclease YlaK